LARAFDGASGAWALTGPVLAGTPPLTSWAEGVHIFVQQRPGGRKGIGELPARGRSASGAWPWPAANWLAAMDGRARHLMGMRVPAQQVYCPDSDTGTAVTRPGQPVAA
jgi:hypothetical protein